jgi:hypothetical protein
MTLAEINNLIENYKRIIKSCKENNLNFSAEYYTIKLQSAQDSRKEILKKEKNT